MKRAFIAIGHGKRPDGVHDPGASGIEHQLANRVGRVVVNNLEAAGLDVPERYEEVDEQDPNFIGTTAAINRLDPDVAVAIHFDWSGAPRGGFGIIPRGRGELTIKGRLIANAIAAQYAKRGLHQRESYTDVRGLYLLKNVQSPTVIWECDKVGTYGDTYIRELGQSIAHGILSYLDIKPTDPKGEQVVLRNGNRGRWVKRFQSWLENLGYDLGRWGADGVFGDDTEAAVRSFQNSNWIPETGKIDQYTASVIIAVHQTWRQHSDGLRPKQNRGN